MPKKSVPPVAVRQEIFNHYFPKSNWMPAITVPGILTPGGRLGLVQQPDTVLVFASCVRCGATIEQQHWTNHINWHTNSLEG